VPFFPTFETINDMPVKVARTILLIILSFPVGQAYTQGLQFKSEDSLLTQRTSYRVFNSHVPTFYGHFYISFDLSLWDNANLGYVFNLADKDLSYSLSYLYNNGAGSLNFNIDSKSNKLSMPIPAAALQKNNWLKVKIELDLNLDNVTIRIDSAVYRADSLGFRSRMPANLVFGKNQYYTEVPNMAIRNLRIGDDNEHHFFPLNEWTGTVVHDNWGNETGYVDNPLWLINSAYFWKEVYTESTQHVAGLNFNPVDQHLFIFTHDSLITVDPVSKHATARPYANKLPVNLVLGKSIVNTRENKCYVYELFDVAKGEPTVAALDLNNTGNLKWNIVGKDELPYQRHHHNVFYDTRQQRFCLFGGYGSYSYHNNFLEYNDSLDKWLETKFTGDPITPRFFSAIGPAGKPGQLLIFGGYGNESGKQVVGGRQYYDCYLVDLQTHTVKKCWQVSPPPGEPFVPANNLILSPDKQSFYVLCYPHEQAHTELKLYKFSLRDGSYEVVSAPIPMASLRIESDVNLFFSDITGEFFCTVQEFADRNSSAIKIYSLNSPPVSTTTYLASLKPSKKPNLALFYLILLPGLATAGALAWFISRHRNPKPADPQPSNKQEAPVPEPITQSNIRTNTLFLLGEFAAFDRKGADITHLFSPKIKQLFLLILFNSTDGKGIVSKKISAKCWPDKDPAKTKNIKGVTFNHLRSILADIDGIELIFANDCYSFRIAEPLFCDYWQIQKQLQNGSLEPEQFKLVARGPLLEDLADPLIDEFKSDYEYRLIAAAQPELKQAYDTGDYRRSLDIARTLLAMDPFNEDVLKYQLKSYRRLKGIEYSRRAYDQFTQDYERSLGVAYHLPFDKIVQ
jgi:DNA-binding SARP family transcriptional activator